MAEAAKTRRIERLEAELTKLKHVAAQLVAALWHHTQDRHDVDMKRDDAPDVRAVGNARRSLQDDKRSREIAAAAREDQSRGRQAGRTGTGEVLR